MTTTDIRTKRCFSSITDKEWQTWEADAEDWRNYNIPGDEELPDVEKRARFLEHAMKFLKTQGKQVCFSCDGAGVYDDFDYIPGSRYELPGLNMKPCQTCKGQGLLPLA